MNPNDPFSNFTTSSIAETSFPFPTTHPAIVIGFLGLMLLTAWKIPQSTSSRAFHLTGVFLAIHLALPPALPWLCGPNTNAVSPISAITLAAAVLSFTRTLIGTRTVK